VKNKGKNLASTPRKDTRIAEPENGYNAYNRSTNSYMQHQLKHSQRSTLCEQSQYATNQFKEHINYHHQTQLKIQPKK